MDLEMAWREDRSRPRMVVFTCWVIWLIAVPVAVLAVARALGMMGFWDDPMIKWQLPDLALIPLSLFALSSIGLWRMKRWGVLVYSFAGLLLLPAVALQPEIPTIPGFASFPDIVGWLIVAGLHVLYSIRLWKEV